MKGPISMQQHTQTKDSHVSSALFQFIIPISLKASKVQHIADFLQGNHYTPFHLNDYHSETAFYGKFHVSHKELEDFFLPITNTILFPKTTQEKGLHRYTKSLNVEAQMQGLQTQVPFRILSADVFICPYELGFLTIRTEINHQSFSQVQEFANCFRYLKNEQLNTITCGGESYQTVRDFIFSMIFPPLQPYLCEKTNALLPPNKMYVHSFISFHEVEVTNPMTFDELSFSYFTNEKQMETPGQITQHFGPFYYSVIINLFHQMVLIKIVKTFSEINIDKATFDFEKLNYLINSFTSNYYFNVYPAQSLGQELFRQLRSTLQIEQLYSNMKETLFSLFKFEENIVTKRDSLLLLILTLYTVVCGIFSMNLFTHDLKGNIKWNHFQSYNPFEYFAVFIVFSGIFTVFFLGLQSLYQGLKKKKKRKEWVQENVLINKKR
ncbi:MAG: hypothetical protein ABGX20_24155 [Bacillus sp. (in: firmicutes)]